MQRQEFGVSQEQKEGLCGWDGGVQGQEVADVSEVHEDSRSHLTLLSKEECGWCSLCPLNMILLKSLQEEGQT